MSGLKRIGSNLAIESPSRTNSNRPDSRPGSGNIRTRSYRTSSITGSTKSSSRPGSIAASSIAASSRTTSLAGSRPGSSTAPSRSGSRNSSRPGSSCLSSRPVSSRSSTRPVSTKSVRIIDDLKRDLEASVGEESECDVYASGSSFGDYETDEGRLSRSLQDWMPEYTVRGIEPRERATREPVYSARLGREPRIKKCPSQESLATQLSLLTCSSNGRRKQAVKRRRRRKKMENGGNNVQTESKWIALAKQRTGALDRMMKTHAAHTFGVAVNEISIFDHLDKDEQRMVFNCGLTRGLHYAPGMKKSPSVSNVATDTGKPRRRRASEGETEIFGPIINFEELRQQVIQKKIAQQARKQMLLARQSSKSNLRKKTRKRSSNASSRRESSSTALSNYTLSTTTDQTFQPTHVDEEKPEIKTTMWAGDQKILEIDLNRELTSKVKGKILTTTRALTRITGYGEDNELKETVGTLEEYPFLVDDDYGYIPKIVQRVRISPQLSRVIHNDIRIRMGRPRYHEISEQDLVVWNKGQHLDRTHRNLKVFNWLHSLREEDFDYDIDPHIDDRPPGHHYGPVDLVNIRAVDEPKVKPLLERLRTEYVI